MDIWGITMLKLRFLAMLLFVVSAGFSTLVLASPQPIFRCDVGDHPSLVRNGVKYGQLIYFGGEFVALNAYPQANEKLPSLKAASGEQYSDGKITFHAKGDLGLLLITNGPTFSCKSLKSEVIAEAKSLVTIVRAAPDVKSPRLDKLVLSEPVQLIGETGKYFQDYQWYKIRYGEGQEGYGWGGTLCVETELSGILIGCARHLKGEGKAVSNTQIAGKSVFGSLIRRAPNAKAVLIYKISADAPLVVIGETGSFHETWQWVEVSVAGKGNGFVWGGTICTIDKQLSGVHFGCLKRN